MRTHSNWWNQGLTFEPRSLSPAFVLFVIRSLWLLLHLTLFFSCDILLLLQLCRSSALLFSIMDIKLFLKSCFSSACCIKSFSKVCFSLSLLDTLPFPLLCCIFHGPPLLFLFLLFISNKLTVNFWAFVFFVWEGGDHLKLPRNCPDVGFILYSVIANKINWT